MKLLCAAFAACLIASSFGCQTLGKNGGGSSVGCGDTPCHVRRSQLAPRPTLCRSACPPGGALLDSPCGGCGGQGCEACGGCGKGYGLSGCNANSCVNGAVNAVLDCAECDNQYNFNQGPPTGQVAYPYYTVRGPRDFLDRNPKSIGPY